MYVAKAPEIAEMLDRITGTPGRLVELARTDLAHDGHEYVHWDKLRHLAPPGGLSHEEWWLLTKLARRRLEVPLVDPDGNSFAFAVPDVVARRLHYVDKHCAGEISMSEVVTADAQAKQRYLVSSLMEEAIRSSQLEGATTTRRVAKDLLRTGREPVDRSERMILNNYLALRYMREEMPDELTPEAVIELQRILTEGTLDNPAGAGKLQQPGDERVAVVDRLEGTVLHMPPPAGQLPARLEALCAFANESEGTGSFIHPAIRAILLHFWLAYDHPFEDGNGRTARALFYWYMRTHGYWLTEYLSISRILREAPAKYSRSFLLTETDERDTTYFIVYQLEVIERAVDQLHAYLQRQMKDVRQVEAMLKGSDRFNHRQLALLANALRAPDATYTLQGHASAHAVTHETARTDLMALVGLGFLARSRQGYRFVFSAPLDLPERIRSSR